MKVVTPKEMALLETSAYHQGSLEADFMEAAGKGIAEVVHSFIQKNGLGKHIFLLCGKGNNAGDAYVAGTALLHKGYEVQAYQIIPIAECSPLCQHSYARFFSSHGIIVEEAILTDHFFDCYDLIIDGIFGTGFRGPVTEPYSSVIQFANLSRKPIFAVDIPSGLNGETGFVEDDAIHAKQTVFLGLPKQGFFFHDGWNCTGRLSFVDFGLPEKFTENAASPFLMLCQKMAKPLLPVIVNNRHKYQAGYVVGLSGSPGMPGAALLSSLSALRGGAGIIRLLHPEGMQDRVVFEPL